MLKDSALRRVREDIGIRTIQKKSRDDRKKQKKHEEERKMREMEDSDRWGQHERE